MQVEQAMMSKRFNLFVLTAYCLYGVDGEQSRGAHAEAGGLR